MKLNFVTLGVLCIIGILLQSCTDDSPSNLKDVKNNQINSELNNDYNNINSKDKYSGNVKSDLKFKIEVPKFDESKKVDIPVLEKNARRKQNSLDF